MDRHFFCNHFFFFPPCTQCSWERLRMQFSNPTGSKANNNRIQNVTDVKLFPGNRRLRGFSLLKYFKHFSAIHFTPIQLVLYSTVNSRHCREAALRKSGYRFKSLLSKPEVTAARRISARWYVKDFSRGTELKREHFLFWVTPDSGIIKPNSLQLLWRVKGNGECKCVKGCSVWASREYASGDKLHDEFFFFFSHSIKYS